MAKRRKSSKCPEPFNTLIDLAAAATLNYIAYKRREKRKGKRSNEIDPYAATGAAMGLGLIDDTEDLIRFGGMLGAMGAFDPDEPDEVYRNSYVGSHDDNPFYAPKNNKYAWRLNCENGSEYGISPEDYETRDEYHEALYREKYAWRDYCEDGSAWGIKPVDYETEEAYDDALEYAKIHSCDLNIEEGDDLDENSLMAIEKSDEIAVEQDYFDTAFTDTIVQPATNLTVPDDLYEDDDLHIFIYCKVVTEQGTDYYRTDDTSIRKGDTVTVPFNDMVISGKVLSVERHMRFSAPKPVNETCLIRNNDQDIYNS